MQAYLNGIGWVTGAGMGWGSRGDHFILAPGPLPALARRDVFAEPNQRFGRMSEYAKLGVAALAFALRDAGLERFAEKRPVGVVASTLLGCLATDLDYQQGVLLEGGGLASPNLFAYTLANCFLGDAAIQFGLTGSLVAINENGAGRLGAVRYALEEIALGESDTVVAGICDLTVPGELQGSVAPATGAVFLVLSSVAPAGQRGQAPAEPVPEYGIVTVAPDGTLAHNGAPVSSLEQLVHAALKGTGSFAKGACPPYRGAGFEKGACPPNEGANS
jgi:3-oxoacyl-[acyl-carrier-protein] synthase II